MCGHCYPNQIFVYRCYLKQHRRLYRESKTSVELATQWVYSQPGTHSGAHFIVFTCLLPARVRTSWLYSQLTVSYTCQMVIRSSPKPRHAIKTSEVVIMKLLSLQFTSDIWNIHWLWIISRRLSNNFFSESIILSLTYT